VKLSGRADNRGTFWNFAQVNAREIVYTNARHGSLRCRHTLPGFRSQI